MTSDLKSLAAAPLPRYTSYPTAPHFSIDVGAERYGRWLSELGEPRDTSLYIHVPYCRSLCWYCGCHMRVENQYHRIRPYVDALTAELRLIAEHLPAGRRLTHLHWGGGTPSILAPEDFKAVMAAAGQIMTPAAKAEMAVEIDPRTLSDAFIEAMAESGINRTSLGIQDFSSTVQAAINRIQPLEMAESAVRRLRAAGLGAINLDLMYGLPYQDEAAIRDTLEKALSLEPERIAAFGYAHVPWLKRHQKLIPEAALPNTEQRLASAELIRETLEGAGFVAIGMDHYARPDDPLALAFRKGTLRRNFQGFTTDRANALLAIGASAIGRLPQGYVQNEADIRAYMDRIASGRLATQRGLVLSDDDRLRGTVIEGIMCGRWVDLEAVCRLYGYSENALDPTLGGLADLERLHLVERDGRRLHVPEEAQAFARHVAARFDAYLGQGAGRHSRAV